MESPILIQIQGRWDYRLRMGSPRGDAPLGPSRRVVPARTRPAAGAGIRAHRQDHVWPKIGAPLRIVDASGKVITARVIVQGSYTPW